MKITELTLCNEEGEYSVKREGERLNIDAMVDNLVIPLLMAAGYALSTIETRIKNV